jgi:hypothetical protein
MNAILVVSHDDGLAHCFRRQIKKHSDVFGIQVLLIPLLGINAIGNSQ